MQINNNNAINFGAKFMYSDSLKQVAEYAVEHDKFDKLNKARKAIDSAFLRTRLKIEIGENNSIPYITFHRFTPKYQAKLEELPGDIYRLTKSVTVTGNKPENPLKFALDKIIKLSHSAPHNNMYKKIVINK